MHFSIRFGYRGSNKTKSQVSKSINQEFKTRQRYSQGLSKLESMIKHNEMHKEDRLDCSLGRQDNWPQEEGKASVRYMMEG